MVSFLNSWVQGIVVAIILATVLEMLVPEGNNKKYVKIIIGIYILFTIISPVINKCTSGKIDFNNIMSDDMQYQKKIEKYSVNYNNVQEKNEKSIQTIYQDNLKKDLTEKLKEKGYKVNTVNFITNNQESYLLEEIRIKLSKIESKTEDVYTNQNLVTINTVNIDIQKEDEKEQEKTYNSLQEKEIQEIKKYLASIYEVQEENIKINE